MGIKRLKQFLTKVCPDFQRDVHLADYAYKKIAVDASIYVCDFKMRYGDRIAEGFVDFITKLREHKIHPIFVFDGEAPEEKDLARSIRSKAKYNQYVRVEKLEDALEVYEVKKTVSPELREINDFKIKHPKLLTKQPPFNYRLVKQYVAKLRANIFKVTDKEFDILKRILDLFNIPSLTAGGEAELLCVQLAKQGLVQAVLTNDTDVLAGGAPEMISITKAGMTSIKIEDILSALDFTEETWLDFCILCGTDFNMNLKGIGPHKAYELLKKHNSIDSLPMDVSVLNHERVREIFTPTPFDGTVGFCGDLKFDEFSTWVFTAKIKVSPSLIRRRLMPVIVVKTKG